MIYNPPFSLTLKFGWNLLHQGYHGGKYIVHETIYMLGTILEGYPIIVSSNSYFFHALGCTCIQNQLCGQKSIIFLFQVCNL